MSFLSEKEIQAKLKFAPQKIGPITISVLSENPIAKMASDSFQADLLLQVTSENGSVTFVAETKNTSSRRAVKEACVKAITCSPAYEAPPIIVVPYLDENQLMEIRDSYPSLSAIDLCGNGLIRLPGKLYVFATGKPNKYPDSRSIKNIYQGSSALVARSFLKAPRQPSVNALRNEIEKLGGKISLSAVSKVLTQLKEDLIVTNKNSELRLFDPLILLRNLLDNYSAPTILREKSIKLKGSLVTQDSIPGILTACAIKLNYKFCMTGASAFLCYGAGAVDPVAAFYTSGDIVELLKTVSESGEIDWTEEDIFPNVRILQAEEQSLFFDSRLYMNALVASPVQCYLELMKGDKRQQEGAEQVKKYILQELEDFIEEREAK